MYQQKDAKGKLIAIYVTPQEFENFRSAFSPSGYRLSAWDIPVYVNECANSILSDNDLPKVPKRALWRRFVSWLLDLVTP